MKGIAILGLGRSGTAFVTQALQDCGCFTGSVNWAYENHEVRRVNDEILKHARGANPASMPYGRVGALSPHGEHRRETKEVIDELVAAAKPTKPKYWVIKDPKLTLLLDVWDRYLDVYVGVFRDPATVVQSYIDVGFINCSDDRGTMIEYWNEFGSILLRLYEEQKKPTYLLHFDATTDRQLEALCEALKLPYRTEQRFNPEVAEFKAAPPPVNDRRIKQLYAKLKKCTVGSTLSTAGKGEKKPRRTKHAQRVSAAARE